MADLFQKCHHDLLEEVKRRNIYPYFHTLESRQAPVVEMEGKRRIMLGSNNYLGFTEDPALFDAGVYVNPVIAPACVEGECLLRTTLMATHTEPVIDEAVDIIARVLKQTPKY